MSEKREHPIPGAHARELVRGAVDYHVHVSPDFVERRIDDLSLARRCLETGLGGFGLKSHYTATVERARVVAAAVPGVTVLGTITLNAAVGGLNPLAVEIAEALGVPPTNVGTHLSNGKEDGEFEKHRNRWSLTQHQGGQPATQGDP